ncbi:potassium channel subfamily K member 2-like [Branchiostoma floridae]|uniref:Potassium channel subfamily K member 2-like n=1 Tax=Branchiostoma floridae TaxID=7739 RepID=A0A9J7LY10_BRAFL|nr:potassium channel subfamily K member 2-like [Branchiostoma floridae]XP_035690525.1 potassium channel subfamily K member 2-like [Branchiostoma floridae]
MSDGQVGWKQITVVFCVLLVILFVGAGIFKALEENFYDAEELPDRVHNVEGVVEEFVKNHSVTNHDVYELLRRVDIARHGYTDSALHENKSENYFLDYMESWYFCMTIVTTIGYGHMGPLTVAGKLFCCIYALIGIPVWIILLTLVGAQLSDSSRWIEKRVRELLVRVTKIQRKFRAPGLAISLTIMVTSFFFLPALVFHKVEAWTYLEAIYFCVITLTTVGFGDFVPALPTEDMNTAANVVYKISVFLWITVGLAFLAGSLERIGTALKILGEKMTDMDLDPAEVTDRPINEVIGETNEAHDDDDSKHVNGADDKNGSDNVINGRKPREGKEITSQELTAL